MSTQVPCVCGCTRPVAREVAPTPYAALEPGVCGCCGHYLYLHNGDRTIDE